MTAQTIVTAEQLHKIIRIATVICVTVPYVSPDRRTCTPTARIDRKLLEELERDLTAIGVDVATKRKQANLFAREHRKAQNEG